MRSPTPLLFLAALAALPGGARAQSATIPPPGEAAPAPDDTVRLSDEKRQAILDGNTLESAAAVRGEATGSARPAPAIHGELEVMVGSNGTRGIYGAAAVPLGDHAAASVSFESSRFGYGRR